MSPLAIRLADILGDQLAELGPGACALSVAACSTWQVIRIGAASNDALRVIAESFALDQARTLRHGRPWWRQMSLRPSGAIVVSASVHRGGAP